jgi:NADPH-dependent curcumin reductase CurA
MGSRVCSNQTPGATTKATLLLGPTSIAQYSTRVIEPNAHIRKADTVTGAPDVRGIIGALGIPGLTAYASLYEIGKPKKSETIFISSAAGAVGQIVGQITKHEGLKVIGFVGSDDKLNLISNKLSFDGGFKLQEREAVRGAKASCARWHRHLLWERQWRGTRGSSSKYEQFRPHCRKWDD